MSTKPNTTTTRRAAKKAAPKVEAPKVKKSDLPEDQRDWTYLADKEPTDLHEDMADWIAEVTGLEVEDREAFIKAVQLTAVLRHVYQRSDRNKARGAYKPLAEEVVAQRSSHMIQAHQDAKKEIEERQARDEAKAKARKEAAAAKRAARKVPAKKSA